MVHGLTMWNEPTDEELGNLPGLYETENTPLEDKLIHMHFFFGAMMVRPDQPARMDRPDRQDQRAQMERRDRQDRRPPRSWFHAPGRDWSPAPVR